MQLMPPTAVAFGVTNRFRIEENIRGGVAYLAYLSRQFRGELRLVAAGYYAGETRIKRCGLQYADPDVVRYVTRVQQLYRKRPTVARPLTGTQSIGVEHP
jgi:soluble lytic murein transglycosylase-like protein